jgi:hypothetical protein
MSATTLSRPTQESILVPSDASRRRTRLCQSPVLVPTRRDPLVRDTDAQAARGVRVLARNVRDDRALDP